MPASPITTAEARIIDPVQSTYARGYTQAGFVGDLLFPSVPIATRGAKRIEFTKDSFKRANSRRAPGTPVQQHMMGFEGKPVNLHQEALAAVTPFEHQEEAGATLGLNLHMDGLDETMDILTLSKEIEQATVATTAANYAAAHVDTPAGTDLWTDDASKPKEQISDAKETIRRKIGRKPNTMILSPTAFTALDNHPALFDIIKRSGGNAVTTDLLARFFDMERVAIGEAVEAADDDTLTDVWGNGVVLAFVSPPSGGNRRSRRRPSFGYTHQLQNYPVVTETYWNRGINSFQSDVFDEWSADMVGPDAGYLITTTDGN
ncbi:MAG: hypothetical protein ABF335_03145 [Alphaproteobacteria bacterium]